MMGYRAVANIFAEWNDATPLIFTLREEVGPEDARHSVIITVDLSDLQEGFSGDFLLHLRDLIIEWRNRIVLNTLSVYCRNLRNIFIKIIKLQLFHEKIGAIDEMFLLALDAVAEKMSANQLNTLKSLFLHAPYSPLWAPGLQAECFPKHKDKKGAHGRQISRILAKSLTRSACVHILSRCEQAYDSGEIDIGSFAFANLAFAVFCRPESYRQILLSDLIFDKKSNAYLLNILPTKSGVRNPKKLAYKINSTLGILLQKQRQAVVNQLSHLVDPRDVEKLALFPATALIDDKSAWLHEHANKNFGMYGTAEAFAKKYAGGIKNLLSDGLSIGANVLRHTLGTQLAQTGASAKTIQAILKHATDNVCKAYVDIAFHGLIKALSDAMQPAFETHLPVVKRFRSKHDPVDANQAIRSDDPVTGKIELTGECGKLIQCEYAPITCYGCLRFIPCWDADHGVNLAIVEREMEDYKRRGKPFQHLLKSAQDAKHHIILIMNAADRYQQDYTPAA